MAKYRDFAPKIAAPAGGPGVVRIAAPTPVPSGAQAIGGKPVASPFEPAAIAASRKAAQREIDAKLADAERRHKADSSAQGDP